MARLDQRLTHAVAELGRDHDLLAPCADRLAEHPLRLATGIDIGGVEEVDTAVDRPRHELSAPAWSTLDTDANGPAPVRTFMLPNEGGKRSSRVAESRVLAFVAPLSTTDPYLRPHGSLLAGAVSHRRPRERA